MRDKRLEGLVKNLFRPSYGGNRNCTLMYTLGGLMVSADDDMRPYTLMEHSLESLGPEEVCRGKLVKAGNNGYGRKSFDILGSFLDVLGKPVREVPDNYERGDLLVDTAMDLETNATKGLARENSLLLRRGPLPDDARVKMAQTFRSGTNDLDAIDYVDMFLDDEAQTNPDDLNDLYVLVNFRPVVTKKNWRMDCGVAGYDNTFGLPPFFPTRLRFEDYIYRLWIQQEGIAAAHVDAAQNHIKSNYMRNPPAAEVFNEEVSNLLKRKIHSTVTRLDELSIAFDYDGEVTADDAQEILDKISRLYGRALETAEAAANAGTRPRGAAVCRQPAEGVLRLRARLLPAEPAADRGRRHQRDQGLDRAVAHAGRDLLLPEGPHGTAPSPGPEPENDERKESCHAHCTSRSRSLKACRRNSTAGRSASSPT